MRKWTIGLLALALACGLTFTGFAQEGKKPGKPDKGAAKAAKAEKALAKEDRALMKSALAFVQALLNMPSAKETLASYRKEAETLEHELSLLQVKFEDQIRESLEGGRDEAKIQEIQDKAKAEIQPVQEKLVDARIKLAEALIAAAKADPKAAATQETADTVASWGRLRAPKKAEKAGGAAVEAPRKK